MANRLYESGITIETVLILPCDLDLVMGLRELWRDLNHRDRSLFLSAELLALFSDHKVETWADFCLVVGCLKGIFARGFRRDRHYLSKSDYSLGRVQQCQWFAGDTFDSVTDQALNWGEQLRNNELTIFNNHAALSAAIVGAHNDSN